MAVEALSTPAAQSYERSSPENPITDAKAPAFDEQTDQKIQALFQFKTFTKQIVEYAFAGKKYQILVLHNPENLPLWGGKGYPALPVQRITSAIIPKGPIPEALEKQLHQLLPSALRKLEQKPSLDHLNFQWYNSLVPAEICPENQIIYFDEQIKAMFATQGKVEKTFIYHWKNEIYRVRFETNPSAGMFYYKFRFYFDRSAPDELTHHLNNLAYKCLSYWGYLFNVYIDVKEESFIKTRFFPVYLPQNPKPAKGSSNIPFKLVPPRPRRPK